MRKNKYFICILFFTFLFCQSCQDENLLSKSESEVALKTSIEKTNIVPGDLTLEESLGLIQMRLEEKLARDVYIFLGNLHDKQIFLNIAESEQKHIDAMKKLLVKYSVNDPIENDELGVFPDENFQTLYDSYISSGESSVQAAIAVGIAIEELDIADLEALLLITDNPDIEQVYKKLLTASQVHLSKFLTHVKLESADEETIALSDLTTEETLGLIQMRLEEKLARDVYIFFGNLYDKQLFLNIAESEQKHIDAMIELLITYSVEDPIIIDELGVFPADFQTLYETYISSGASSVQAAIEVGIDIEEINIADFEAQLLITDNPDIEQVYKNLLAASKVHLSKFLTHVKPETIDNNSSSVKRTGDQRPRNHVKVIRNVK